MALNPDELMRRAIELARQGLGRTAPNPAVGAVIEKDGEILAEGWHRKCGEAHAERDAISGRRFPGATIYVTLEPCSTHGRTGACVEAIIKAGILRCIYAVKDPNPSHAGRADEILKAAGVEVESGLLGKEAEVLIRGFRSVQIRKRPWVIAKTAMSLDGKITRPAGESQWLTGKESRARVQQLRNEVDAILTGGQTVRMDNPALTVREFEREDQPLRAVMTRQGLAGNYQIFTDEYSDRTRVFESGEPEEVLRTLVDEGCNTILLEAGGSLIGSFSDAGLIDEWMIFLAPLLTGGNAPAVGGEGAASIAKACKLGEVSFERCGDDVVLRGIVNHQGSSGS